MSHYGKAVREKKEKGTGGRKGNRIKVPDESLIFKVVTTEMTLIHISVIQREV